MAIKEIYHTVASVLPIDTDTGTIPAGRIVTLDANFLVTLPAAAGDEPVGMAGDTQRQSPAANNPESASLITGSYQTAASGATRWSQNRVADNYNETLASSEMTVYHGAGEFWTDEYSAAVVTWGAAAALYNTIAAPQGQWTTAAVSNRISGLLLGDPQALESGVPGVAVRGSISFGNYIHLRLWH